MRLPSYPATLLYMKILHAVMSAMTGIVLHHCFCLAVLPHRLKRCHLSDDHLRFGSSPASMLIILFSGGIFPRFFLESYHKMQLSVDWGDSPNPL